MRPSDRRFNSNRIWLAVDEYSIPCARNMSGEAVLARSESASAGVICGRSISARSGSPSAD